MHRFAVGGVSVILLLHVSMLPSNSLQQPKDPAPVAGAIPSYPESAEGLKHLIEDIFGALKAGENEKASSYFSGLVTMISIEFHP
jgi:hypothetical protein